MNWWTLKQLRAMVITDLASVIPPGYFASQVARPLLPELKSSRHFSRELAWGQLAGPLGKKLFFESEGAMSARQTAASEVLMHLGMLAAADAARGATAAVSFHTQSHGMAGSAGEVSQQLSEHHIPTFLANVRGGLRRYLKYLSPKEAEPFWDLLVETHEVTGDAISDGSKSGKLSTDDMPYSSVLESIEPYVECAFERLPLELKRAVRLAFFPMPHWDELSPHQRRSLAEQYDAQHDPKQEAERTYWFDLASEIGRTERDIASWEGTNDRNIPSEALLRRTQISLLRTRLTCLTKFWELPPFAVSSWFEISTEALTTALANADRKMAEPTATPIQRSAAQDATILAAIRALEQDPLSLPRARPGKPGVKAQVREAVGTKGIWSGATVFDKAWERLRKSGEIQDCP